MGIYLVGVAFGLFLLAAALFNWESLFADPESRTVEILGGPTAVRWYWGIGGLAAIGISVFYWLRS